VIVKDDLRGKFVPADEGNVYNNFKENFMGDLYGNSEIILDRHRIVNTRGDEDSHYDPIEDDLEQNYETFNANNM
jgi:hypothetical protein